jgi:hypothetical protein
VAKKQTDERKKLQEELHNLIEEIPEDGLKFLIDQANIILYNRKVDELNKAAERLNAGRGGTTGEKSPAEADNGESEERLTWVEEGSKGRSMFLVINNQRKIMDQENEMLPLVKIAHSTSYINEGCEWLYRWFHRERDVVIFDAVLTPEHPAMRQLYTYLREHFSLNK